MTTPPGTDERPEPGHQPAAPPALLPPPPPAVATPPLPPPPNAPGRYPMAFDVLYPDRLSRLSTFFRGFLLVPIALVLGLLQYFITIALMFGWMTVFWRKKYPMWLFHALSGSFDYTARAWAYGALLTDQFPSFSREQSMVSLDFDDPPSGYLSRWRVLFWKGILLFPHMVVLQFLAMAVFVVTVLAWFGILFTGNYPRGMFQFSVGVQRWYHRVTAYFASFNDRYPPYALAADAGPASNAATVASGVGGWLVAGGYAVLIGVVASLGGGVKTDRVDYERLVQGRAGPSLTFEPALADGPVILSLERAYDPGDDLVLVLTPARGERIVVFEWEVWNRSGAGADIVSTAVSLRFEFDGDDGLETRRDYPEILTVGNRTVPARIEDRARVTVQAVFVLPEDAEPLELRFSGGFAGGGVRYLFE